MVEDILHMYGMRKKNNDYRRIKKSFKRSEIKVYPGASLREMVMNAICHADYFICPNIKLEFFLDRAEITSPGGIFDKQE